MKHCRSKKICLICEKEFHGYCDKELKCVNYGCNHRPTDRMCNKFQLNIEIKKLMTNESLNIAEARKKAISNRNNGGNSENSKHKSSNNSVSFGRISNNLIMFAFE